MAREQLLKIVVVVSVVVFALGASIPETEDATVWNSQKKRCNMEVPAAPEPVLYEVNQTALEEACQSYSDSLYCSATKACYTFLWLVESLSSFEDVKDLCRTEMGTSLLFKALDAEPDYFEEHFLPCMSVSNYVLPTQGTTYRGLFGEAQDGLCDFAEITFDYPNTYYNFTTGTCSDYNIKVVCEADGWDKFVIEVV